MFFNFKNEKFMKKCTTNEAFGQADDALNHSPRRTKQHQTTHTHTQRWRAVKY